MGISPIAEAEFYIQDRGIHGKSENEREKTSFYHLQRVLDYAKSLEEKLIPPIPEEILNEHREVA